MTDLLARSTARREIRPYKGLKEIQYLFDRLVISWGETEINSGGYANMSEGEYLKAGVTLQLMVTLEEDAEPVYFPDLFDELLIETGLSAADIQFQAVARSPYLKLVEVLWKGGITELRNQDRKVQLASSGGNDRPKPFLAWSSGCVITFSATLKKKRKKRPLEPSRKGTWLGRSQFVVDTDTGEIGFTPIKLDAAERARLGLGSKAIRYVDVSQSVIDSDVDDSDLQVYIDEDLLDHVVNNSSTPGARSFQHQILLWALEAIVSKASRELKGQQLPSLDVIQGSFVEKVITWTAGGSEADSETKGKFLEVIRDSPEIFMTYVETAIGNLQSELIQTMTEAN